MPDEQVNPVPSHSVRTRKDEIKRLRHAKGWTADDLAMKAGHSLRSIQKAEAGGPVYISTVANIAAALGVDPTALLQDRKPKTSLTINVIGQLTDDPEQSSRLQEIAAQFAEVIGAKGTVYIVAVQSGSIHIDLAFDNTDDLARAISALAKGELLGMGVESITLPNMSRGVIINSHDELIAEFERLRQLLRSYGKSAQPYVNMLATIQHHLQDGQLELVVESSGDWLIKATVPSARPTPAPPVEVS